MEHVQSVVCLNETRSLAQNPFTPTNYTHGYMQVPGGKSGVFPYTDLLFNCLHEKKMYVATLFGSYLVSQDSLLHHPGIVVEFHA